MPMSSRFRHFWIFLAAALFFLGAAVALSRARAAAETAGVGKVEELRGKASLERAGIPGMPLGRGDKILAGDILETAEDSSLRLALLDETTFTLGPASRIVVDEFVYDSGTGAGRMSASFAKGVFRFVTGKIAKKDPESVTVKLPAGYIGVRGTTVGAQVAGVQSLVFLMETVRDGKPELGKAVLGNEVGGQKSETVLDEAGAGSRIEGPDSAPTPKFQVPEADIRAMMDPLIPENGGGDDAFSGVDGLDKGGPRKSGSQQRRLPPRLESRELVPDQDVPSRSDSHESESHSS
jgi:hypothetical protein